MNIPLATALILTALHSGALYAQAENIQFSGFATVGAVHGSSKTLPFARIGVDAPGDQDPDFGPDTVLGLQASYRLSPRSTAALQFVSRETARNDYAPRVSLAFLSHQFAPELTARAGRLRIPFFMLSESIDINYSNPWVRPPVEVYGLNPFSDLDGADVLYRTQLKGMNLEVHPYVGASSIPIIRGGTAKLKRLRGLRATLDTGELIVSAGHAAAELSVQRTAPAVLAFINAMPEQARAYINGSGARVTFSSIGFQWDKDNWQFSGELARSTADRFTNSAKGGYFTAAYRFGAFTPYLSLARQRQDDTLVPDGLAADNNTLRAFNRSRNQAQKSITTGIRWDIDPQVALKAELSHVRTDRGALGSFFPRGNVFAEGLDDRKINLLSVSVDVVF
jgi:hypothetical protein